MSNQTNVTLECEVLTPSGDDNSFFISFDNGTKYAWGTGQSTSWKWVTVGHTFSLGAGAHTLHIDNREDGSQLRKLRITLGGISTGSSIC